MRILLGMAMSWRCVGQGYPVPAREPPDPEPPQRRGSHLSVPFGYYRSVARAAGCNARLLQHQSGFSCCILGLTSMVLNIR